MIAAMTNTIVLLSILLQTNWSDTTVMNGGMQIQVGRVQTNYVVSPPAGYIKKDTLWVTSAQLELSVGRYPILTSQPFFGPYNLVREVPHNPPAIWWEWSTNGVRGWILTNDKPSLFLTNIPNTYTIPLP